MRTAILTDEQIREWFKDHQIVTHTKYPDNSPISEFLRWKKLDTVHYLIDYIVKDGYLIVSGDLGDAIYQWSPPITLPMVAGFNLDYFHSKCQASEGGRTTDWYEWDEDTARQYVFDHFKDYQDCAGYKKFKDEHIPLYSKEEFNDWLHAADPTEIFGQDWWGWLPSIGNVFPIRCRAHLIGLQVAFNIKKE